MSNTCSTGVQHMGEQKGNPSIFNLQPAYYVGVVGSPTVDPLPIVPLSPELHNDSSWNDVRDRGGA